MSRLLLALEENVPDPYRATSIPNQVVLKGSMLKAFIKLIPYFEILDRWEGHKPSYKLTSDRLFEGDEGTWEMFVRLFFPFLAPKIRGETLFLPDELGTFTLNPNLYSEEEIQGLLEYLGVPPERQFDLLRELHEVHTLHAFYTRPALALHSPSLRSGYNANLALTPNGNENTTSYNANNENENENNLENNVYGKLSSVNYRRFMGSTKSRKGKTKKLKKKSG
jgi:hypothetical protein